MVTEAVEAPGLLDSVLAGDVAAWVSFQKATADAVWTACRHVSQHDKAAAAHFHAVFEWLAEDDFRLLRQYDGASGVKTYLQLCARNIVARRVVRLFDQPGNAAWRAFEAFFKLQIQKRIARRLPRPALWEDAYQFVAAGLIKDDYKRLKEAEGKDSAPAFVMAVVRNLVEDFARSLHGRDDRPPAAVQKLPELERLVFDLVYRKGEPPDPVHLAAKLAFGPSRPLPEAEVAAALARVQKALPPDYSPHAKEVAITPEATELETPERTWGQRQRSPEDDAMASECGNALDAAIHRLPPQERSCAMYLLEGCKRAEIAAFMKVTEPQFDKIRLSLLTRLKVDLEGTSAAKDFFLSV
jgi:RNA polymerase sigma factor (sigma-70 family)